MTSFEAVNILYSYLSSTLMTLPNKPAGVLRRYRRPLNSVSEDVVVNSLPLSHGKLQKAILNVNIHVPNLDLSTDKTQPNAKRLQELAMLATDLLDKVTGNGYRLQVEQENIFEDTNNSHYVNLRVAFQHLNC
jgi:hypothetical protein